MFANTGTTHSWAATTGRPPTIPTNYLRQYECLLNFEQVTIKDVCIHAEILLFITLHEKLAQKSYLEDDGSCEELTVWKKKWAYLFGQSLFALALKLLEKN